METIHCYDSNGYYLGESETCENPVDGGLLMPSNSTQDAPGEYDGEHLPKWNGSSWDIVDDPSYVAEQARLAAEQVEIDAVAAQQASDDAALAAREALSTEAATKETNLKKWHLLYNNVTGEILVFNQLSELVNNLDETVPRYNGLPITDESNSEIDELVYDFDSPPTDPLAMNEYQVKLKKIDTGAIADRIQNTIDTESDPIALAGLKTIAIGLLYKTDYIVSVPDAGITQEVKDLWITYRQALRDLPENTVDPKDPTWPTPPVEPVVPGVN